ncbi:hypothetical protein [Nocardia sp. NPDC050793]|uniref:hypothetical protein n=1 Tax=Nocardia sp. NPDC050793 TaxID=3155159 RepID=UPI0033C4CAC8
MPRRIDQSTPVGAAPIVGVSDVSAVDRQFAVVNHPGFLISLLFCCAITFSSVSESLRWKTIKEKNMGSVADMIVGMLPKLIEMLFSGSSGGQ